MTNYNDTGQIKVTNMMPMTLKCNNCGDYAYTGTKFWMKMEKVKD